METRPKSLLRYRTRQFSATRGRPRGLQGVGIKLATVKQKDLNMTMEPQTPLNMSIRMNRPNRMKTTSISFETPRVLRTIADDNLQGSKLHSSSITERALKIPDLKKPLRIELPAYFNTPRRTEPSNSSPDTPAGLPKLGLARQNQVESEEKIRILKRLKDYQMLALACKRAKKAKDEGRAHYSMGVLFDNLGNTLKAIECYERFLAICKKVNDQHGEALAYNCLGVNHQLLGEEGSKEATARAIEYHTQHRDISDVHGKFIAHINLGLLYASEEDRANSNVNYQFALKYAIMLASPVGQSLALGNMTELLPGPQGRIQDIAEQYLKICTDLNNRKAEAVAYMQLGKICAMEKNYAKGSVNFARALQVSKEESDQERYNEAKCNFAYTSAQMRLTEHFNNILSGLPKLQRIF